MLQKKHFEYILMKKCIFLLSADIRLTLFFKFTADLQKSDPEVTETADLLCTDSVICKGLFNQGS